MQHLPYNTDFAPYDILLFLMLKEKLRGRKFNAGCKVIEAVHGSLNQLLGKRLHYLF